MYDIELVLAFVALGLGLFFLASKTDSKGYRFAFTVGGLLVFYGMFSQVATLAGGYTVPTGLTVTYYTTSSVASAQTLTYTYDFLIEVILLLYVAMSIIEYIANIVKMLNFKKKQKADVNMMEA